MYAKTKIDWNTDTWKSDANLKAYIRKFGNIESMKDMDHHDLLDFAKKTEKARILIDTEMEICEKCQKTLNDCGCERCKICFLVECVCSQEKKIIIDKFFITIPKEIDIAILQKKIQIKLCFIKISKIYNNKKLSNDIKNFVIMIAEIYCKIKSNDIIDLFEKIDKSPKIDQLYILSTISQYLKDLN